MVVESKRCLVCGALKLLTEFPIRTSNGSPRNECRVCTYEYTKGRKAKLTAAGLCSNCGKSEPVVGRIWCESCYLKNMARARLGGTRYVNVLTDQLAKQKGVCPYTGRQLVVGENISVEHVLPVSTHPELRRDPSNILLVDKYANAAKSNMAMHAFKQLIADMYATLCVDSEED